ncbi:MAG: PHP domain-containing protein, partial [Anaerolineae bacterium]|nr:PHP domain-containing protein [Anaerolineae bacterium]
MPGLQFYKLDLHTHTPASKCYLDKTHTPEQIVKAALDQGLAAIAITDHNTAEWIDRMKAAAKDSGLVIFPGVEISMEQYHVVALFDPSVSQKDAENFLGSLDIKAEEYGKSETICPKNIGEVLVKIHERNGLAILAHIDAPKGVFFELVKTNEGKLSVPQAVRKLLNEGTYDAVECVSGRLPDGLDREHQFTRSPAFFQSSDNPHPEERKKHSFYGIGELYSWFKLDQIDLEGLRQCFADPEVRIHMMDQQQHAGAPR